MNPINKVQSYQQNKHENVTRNTSACIYTEARTDPTAYLGMRAGGTQEHRQVARGGGDHVVVLRVGEGAGLHVSAVAGELVEASDHDVALGGLHSEGLDVASRAKFFTEVDQAVQLGLGAGSDNLAVHDGNSPHVASEAQLVALELDIVAEALEGGQLEASAVDVD